MYPLFDFLLIKKVFLCYMHKAFFIVAYELLCFQFSSIAFVNCCS